MSEIHSDEARDIFEALYEEYHDSLYAFFYSRTTNRANSLDLMQNTFLRLWRHMDRLLQIEVDQRRFWIFCVARNLLVDFYRSQAIRSHAAQLIAIQPSSQMNFHTTHADSFVEDEQLRLLDEAISELPEELRTILVMHLMGKMSSAKIGAALGIPSSTIRYKLSVARRKLSQKLQQINSEYEETGDEIEATIRTAG